jgi:Asp-tRNA(Asn)/Glu-tRNA(Gln) amidotransferase A subunit family amidase
VVVADRRSFLAQCASAGFAASVAEALWNRVGAQADEFAELEVLQDQPRLTRDMVKSAEAIAGVTYSDAERDQMLELLSINLKAYRDVRLVPLQNRVPPAFQFSAMLPGRSYPGSRRATGVSRTSRPAVVRPQEDVELAYLRVVELAELIRTRQVTSTELTRLYLARLQRYNPQLRSVITVTHDRALRQAAEADAQIADGKYIGPLHGIPYGVKDIFSVPGYPTTWGVAAYKDRVLTSTASVVQKLDAAGAVLVAKLSMGEIGLSDIWFGGQTMSPWHPDMGAKGSSAGSASSVAAGMVGFAIGSETMGSIVVPASRNAVTALRPTFGRVSRSGAMIASWTLDKVGPMARGVEDCAVILEAIAGPDGRDPTVAAVPYAWDATRPLSSVRVGYFKSAFDAPRQGKDRERAALDALSNLGVQLIPVELPTDIPINALLIIRVEAVAAFDEIVRSRGLDRLKEQHETAWPNTLRAGRLVPAYEYLQAQRLRTELMLRLDDVFRSIDVLVAPSPSLMVTTNLTGHPCVVVPNGFAEDGTPVSISLIGRPFAEAETCTVARALQATAMWHRLHPREFSDL